MSDRPMAAQECCSPAETRDPVHVRNQARDEQHRRRGARDFIQSRAAESDASQSMRYGFHAVLVQISHGYCTIAVDALPAPCITGFRGRRKSAPPFCHSERSEESLFLFWGLKTKGSEQEFVEMQ